MDFLKEVLGEELYGQFEKKINAYNRTEKGKSNHIKLADLSSGRYVGKGKYYALKEDNINLQLQINNLKEINKKLQDSIDNNKELQQAVIRLNSDIKKLQENASNIEKACTLKKRLGRSDSNEADVISKLYMTVTVV